ncbi:CoA-transferase [Xanthobacter sp. KR7-65]|uniref:CoA transferase subunit A n=1 Tax=Xanthobacter sp. KR7-65 TaxID=3156612 RepID=UPI0032B57B5A
MNEIVAPALLQRKSKIIEIDAALDHVRDGMTVAIGGFINAAHPMLVVRGLIRRGLKNLTVVGAASAGLELDLLIASGCVAKVAAPYISGEKLAPIGPAFRAAAEAGRLSVYELDEALYYCALRAAAQRVPFNPWKAGVGTSFPKVNPAIKEIDDPISGERILAIPALNIDVAFLHAAVSDRYGNVQHNGHGYGDRAIAAASDLTFVQVEHIVSNEEIKRDPLRTTVAGADGVIRAPFGAHPYSSPGFYREDQQHIREYVAAATTLAKTGDDGAIRAYIAHYVTEPADHVEYLERVGLRRLLSLDEY